MSLPPIIVRSDLDDAVLSAAAFRVLGHLARRAGRDGNAYPAASSMARICRLNRDTVWQALKELENAGWMKRQRRPSKTSLYTLANPAGGNEGLAEKEGCPVNAVNGGGKERVVAGGDRGVVVDGKEGAQRVSIEGNPEKGIQRRESREGVVNHRPDRQSRNGPNFPNQSVRRS